MLFTILMVVLLILVISTGFVLFFALRPSTRSSSNPSLSTQPEEMAVPFQAQLSTPEPYTPPSSNPNRPVSPQAGYDPNYFSFSDRGANQATRSAYHDGSFSAPSYAQSYSTVSVDKRSQYEFAQRTPAKSPRKNTELYERELEYERGMLVTYDDYLDAVHLVLTNVVMKTSTEVDLAFQVCTRKIQAVLWSKGKERAALLVDIAGLVIGGDATTVWGQSLKACWDTICSVAGKDQYLAAHYNSKASAPSQEQLQEKIRRIQIMTAAVLNDFQSNIFDTREEAVAFLQRMRELKAS
jgi:hypothetical protein